MHCTYVESRRNSLQGEKMQARHAWLFLLPCSLREMKGNSNGLEGFFVESCVLPFLFFFFFIFVKCTHTRLVHESRKNRNYFEMPSAQNSKMQIVLLKRVAENFPALILRRNDLRALFGGKKKNFQNQAAQR